MKKRSREYTRNGMWIAFYRVISIKLGGMMHLLQLERMIISTHLGAVHAIRFDSAILYKPSRHIDPRGNRDEVKLCPRLFVKSCEKCGKEDDVCTVVGSYRGGDQ